MTSSCLKLRFHLFENISDALPARFLFSVGSAKVTGLNPWCCSNLLTASHSLCSCCKSMQHVTITCINTCNLISKPMHAETSEITVKISIFQPETDCRSTKTRMFCLWTAVQQSKLFFASLSIPITHKLRARTLI